MVDLDMNQFEKLCGLQCTIEEIAYWFGCEPDDVRQWCLETYDEDYDTVFEKKSVSGKISLRRAQFKLAEKNANMAMWLGKQYLGQSDKATYEEPAQNSLIDLRERLKLAK